MSPGPRAIKLDVTLLLPRLPKLHSGSRRMDPREGPGSALSVVCQDATRKVP